MVETLTQAAMEAAAEQAARIIREERNRARQDIKRRLGEYRDLKDEQVQIEKQLKYLDGAPSGMNLDGMPRSSGPGDPVASIVGQRLALTEKYEALRDMLTEAQLHIEVMIESLDPVERKLLRHRYIEGLAWEGVCVAMSYSWRQTHRIHAMALDKLVKKEKGPGL